MKVFDNKAVIAVAVLVGAFSSPASATQGPSMFDQASTGFHRELLLDDAFLLANQICAENANVQDLVMNAPIGATEKAIALGEAARQLAAGQCRASQGAIDGALNALKGATPGDDGALQLAYDNQKNSGGSGQGNGIAGLGALGGQKIGSTIVGSGPGSNTSPR